MADVICPFCRNPVPPGQPICGRCFGATLRAATRGHTAPVAEPTPDGRERPRDPLGLGRGGGPRILVLEFATGRVTVEPGGSAVLGREPEISPYARIFAHHGNVSRRHATIGVERDGRAWIRDESSTNGTFVNGRPTVPGDRHALHDGDTLRLGVDLHATVHLLDGAADLY